MAPNRLSRARTVAVGDRGVYGMRLGEGPLHATGLRKQRSTHPLEMRTDGVEDFAEPHEGQPVRHLAVAAGVELVKALQIAAVERCALVSDILTEPSDRPFRQFLCAS